MKEPADLLDQFAELVLSADDPRRLANRTLDVLGSMMAARSGGVFSVADAKVTLYASHGIDQTVLDAMETVWKRHRESLRARKVFYVPDRPADRRLPEAQRAAAGAQGFLVMPVFDGDALVALLYLDSDQQDFCDEDRLGRLAKFSRILVKAVKANGEGVSETVESPDVRTYPTRAQFQDMERQKLLVLLDQQQWNIARVARLMGITRRTVYSRLTRYKVPRRPVPRGRPRLRPATN